MDDQQGTLFGEWGRKDATLSDTTARKEYGLTQVEIINAIRANQLHYREGSAHGNPFLRLLRREVEALVEAKHGAVYLKTQLAQAEVQKISKELKTLKTQIVALEVALRIDDVTPSSTIAAGKAVRKPRMDLRRPCRWRCGPHAVLESASPLRSWL